MKRLLIFCWLLLPFGWIAAQDSAHVLFIGNSYTEVNNLPQMTAIIAASMGQTITWSSNTPGGCTFNQHCTNQSMTLIQQGGWDFVVLQEQSQYPSFPQAQVESEVFPYAAQLVDAVYESSPCGEPMFYMTWGRKNGDARNAEVFPVLGTYEGMDSMLYMRYMYMAESNDASVCPVGRVWRYLRENHRDIELYQSDDSHPSTAGTYAAACAFYVMFFGGNPSQITFTPSGIDTREAELIRNAVHEVVYLHLSDWKRPQPSCSIEPISVGLEASFVAHVSHADSIFWNFGDGLQTSLSAADSTISHTYADTGLYNVTLVATRHCLSDTTLIEVRINSDTSHCGITVSSTAMGSLMVSPNPCATLPVINLGGKTLSPHDSEITFITPDGRQLPYSNTLPAGIYIIRVANGNRIYTAKFVKL